ncbi:ThiF family adenylyltransferase [Myxococcus sp. AM009]|uniref:ThiF family adenylyltransferase n=1 Tax=Myxococcus sp. AM009 TaxID=2745137 RepID=UPI0015953833|nr:ThiF family adenylyltransferase [Myxococcus sp. AM009]NVI98864.1 ThiF family adenylyltransferase [Myxococcus sp. AM009]
MPFPSDLSHEMKIALLERLSHGHLIEECGRVVCLQSFSGPQSGPLLEPAVVGVMKVGGHAFTLQIRLTAAFPRCLPEVRLIKESEPPLDLPHRFDDSQLCFTSDANLLDWRSPERILDESLMLVRAHLERMLEVDRPQEYLREAFAYWQSTSRGRSVRCSVSINETPRELRVYYDGAVPLVVAEDAATCAQILPDRSTKGLHSSAALYVPLAPLSVDPNFRLAELASTQGLRKYVQSLPESHRKVIAKFIASHGSQGAHFVVLAMRRPEEERTLIGVSISAMRGGHPFTDNKATAAVVPYTLLRMDRAYLERRGGANTGFQRRRVLLAGCGAVGGYIALALARAGVGHISLADTDFFTPDNVYRHVCGMSALFQPKVQALKSEIERSVPYVSVSEHSEELGGLLRQRESWVKEHDLVISATGHPTAELDLNVWSWSNSAHPPVLFTWLEPLGLGGHALLTHVSTNEGATAGCLECLHSRPYDGGPLENRAAFATPGGTYTRDTLGCGSRYLPFSDLDAQRTAEMASRIALQVLSREQTTPTLASWKGNRRAFENAGYCVTPRFEMDSAGKDFLRADCACCGTQ